MVEERFQRKEQVVYAITQRGPTVLKSFREIKKIFPLEEEKRHTPILF